MALWLSVYPESQETGKQAIPQSRFPESQEYGKPVGHINGKPECCISIFLDKWLSVFPFIQKTRKLEKKQSRNTVFQRARYMEKQEAIPLYSWSYGLPFIRETG